jgi:hypothetical protein
MWKYTACASVIGRLPRSPATPGFDRKTVRRYLNGEQKPRVRARPSPNPFDPFVDYVSAKLVEDPHLWARTLFDEGGHTNSPMTPGSPAHARPAGGRRIRSPLSARRETG